MIDQAAIAVRNLSVAYGPHTVVSEVSFGVAPGTVYALLGRNGAGKSSIIRSLLGHRRTRRGEVRLLGLDPWSHRAELMARVGVVPEVPDFPPELSARRIAAFFAALYPRWDAAGFGQRLRRFGVPDGQPTGRLSRGQRAQLSLSLALSHTPELLVLDDPTLGLDAVARHELFDELIGELADRGTTVFVTTHDLAGIEGIADRVGMLHGGRLIVDEEVESLKAGYRRRIALHAVAAVGGEASPGTGPRTGDEGEAMTLEEIFVELAGNGTEAAR
jgi:ABC-2 type transport system ATP-binding protein